MSPRPEYRSYSIAGQAEQVLSFGGAAPRRILIVPPLFDEMNRVRRMLVQAMRILAEAQVGSLLPDLPGCNESCAELAAQNIESWAKAVEAAAYQSGATHVASLRGGALIDHGNASLPHWRLAPAQGASLLKTMIRTRIAGDREAGRATTEAELLAAARTGPIDLAGNRIGPAMIAQLGAAKPHPLVSLALRRLGYDVTGSPLWLRAEPQDDPAMSAAIAADLESWSAACAS